MSDDTVGGFLLGLIVMFFIMLALASVAGPGINREEMGRCMSLFDSRDKCYKLIYED